MALINNPTGKTIFGGSAALPEELERIRQEKYGREMITLPKKPKPPHLHTTTTTTKPVQQIERRKIKKTGHEACLSKVVSERRMVEITFLNESVCLGELLEFDKYSMRVRDQGGDTFWFFKSSMKGFKELGQ